MSSGHGNLLTFGLSSAIYSECNLQSVILCSLFISYFSSDGLSSESPARASVVPWTSSLGSITR